MRHFFLSLAATATLLFVFSTVSAQTWTGAAGTDWHTAGNWAGGLVPAATGVVLIPATANKPVISAAAVAKRIKVETGAALSLSESGSLTLRGAGDNYALLNEGAISNNGSITIGSQSGSYLVGIENNFVFVNESGSIIIDRISNAAVLNHGDFTNKALLEIGQITNGGNTGIYNTGSFYCNSLGNVNIDRIVTNGIFNDWGANFSSGTAVYIGKNETIGQNGVLNYGAFRTTGVLDISNTGQSGIANGAGNAANGTPTFRNEAVVNIGKYGNIGQYGIKNNVAIIVSELVSNNVNLFISINATGLDGIYNQSGDIFFRAGTVVIGEGDPAGAYGIRNGGSITVSSACAWISSFQSIKNNAGATITNKGIIQVRNVPVGTNEGSIINNGAIAYTQGVLSGVTNNNLMIAPVAPACMGQIIDYIQKGPNYSINLAADIYDFPGFSNIVGKYNQTTNIFTPTNLNFGTTGVAVSATISDPGGSCLTTLFSTITTTPDAVPPTMLCKPAKIYLNATGVATLNVSDINNGSFDNCGLAQISVNQTTFNCAQISNYPVTLAGTDNTGNTAACTTTVGVSDAMPPKAICKPATISLDAAGQATLSAAQVNNGSFDNCTLVGMSVSPTSYNCAHAGLNNIATFVATDASGNTASCTAVITVKDAIAPIARCKNATVNLAANGSVTVAASEIDNGSTDNCSISLSLSSATFNCANVGKNNVTFKATDVSGNIATCAAIITVRDVTPPTALCKNVTIYLDNSGSAVLSPGQINNGSTDACGIASMTLSNTQFSCADLNGTPQTITMTVKDIHANVATCTAQVITKDNLAPTAVCENATVQLGTNGTVTVYPAALASNSFDNCSVWSYSPVAKVYTSANLGNNNLSITVKDWTGNAATCVSIVTVQPHTGLNNNDLRNEEIEAVSTDLNFILYPNPASRQATVAFSLPETQPYSLRLFDLSGKLIYEQTTPGLAGENNVSIPLESISFGVYLVDFQSQNVRKQAKLIVANE